MLTAKALLLALVCLSGTSDSRALPLDFDRSTLTLTAQPVVDDNTWISNIAKYSPAQIGNLINSNKYGTKDSQKSWFSSLIQSLKKPSSVYITEGVISTTSIPRSDFESWLEVQKEISFQGILNNIGGFGEFEESDNVTVGAVIASPSKKRPNYFYQWIRDGAITINSLSEYLDDHEFDDSMYNLAPVIESYIINARQIQRVSNPTGDFDTLNGLGEPKFMPDSTPFTDHWGRPQRDGPGLRVITITNYLNLLKKYGKSLVKSELVDEKHIYEEIVKPDLKYIIKSWSETGFDLWEEIDSLHLFTSLTQLKAIKLGLQLSAAFEDSDFYDELARTFNALRFFIAVDSGYRVNNIPYLIETPSLVVQGKRSGLDIASILGSLRAHDLDDSTDSLDIPFPIDDASVLNTLGAMVNDMKYRYPINHNRLGFSTGFALGRYPEDVYDGYGTSEGNPWFIATATASELVYKIIYNLYNYQKDLVISIEQKPIFEAITNMKIEGETVLPYGSSAFSEATSSLFSYADAFMDVIREHVDNDGHMSEQFNKYSGYMEGAEDLTWSYGALWSSMRWRNKSLNIMNGKE